MLSSSILVSRDTRILALSHALERERERERPLYRRERREREIERDHIIGEREKRERERERPLYRREKERDREIEAAF